MSIETLRSRGPGTGQINMAKLPLPSWGPQKGPLPSWGPLVGRDQYPRIKWGEIKRDTKIEANMVGCVGEGEAGGHSEWITPGINKLLRNSFPSLSLNEKKGGIGSVGDKIGCSPLPLPRIVCRVKPESAESGRWWKGFRRET